MFKLLNIIRKNIFFVLVALSLLPLFFLRNSWVQLKKIDLSEFELVNDSELISHIDSCQIDKNGYLQINGWAFVKISPGKGDILLLANNENLPNKNLMIPIYHVERNDVLNHFSIPIDPGKNMLVGFEASGYIASENNIRIDLISIKDGLLRRLDNVCQK